MENYTGKMACAEDFVLARLQSISFPSKRYVIHKGYFEELVKHRNNFPEKICFAYVDFDFYEPVKLVLEFFQEKSTVGAIAIVDDYNFFSTSPKLAVDEFIQEQNAQGFIYDCFIPTTELGHFAILTRTS
jgi:hypothetical protein